jgi:hypothetical protein
MFNWHRKAYGYKGYKSGCIKTRIGPVEFKRVVNEHIYEDGNKQYVYLLDEYLKLKTIGFMSINLVEKQ